MRSLGEGYTTGSDTYRFILYIMFCVSVYFQNPQAGRADINMTPSIDFYRMFCVSVFLESPSRAWWATLSLSSLFLSLWASSFSTCQYYGNECRYTSESKPRSTNIFGMAGPLHERYTDKTH